MGKRPRQNGTTCRVMLDIYLVGYGREGEKSREREGGREKWGEAEAASSKGRWKRKGLRLEAEDLLASADRGREWA